MPTPSEEVSASLAKARSATGIESPDQDSADETAKNDQLEADEAKAAEAAKIAKSEEDEEIEEDEEADEESDEGEEDTASKTDAPPAKKRSPLNAAFAQIGELQKGMKDLVAVIHDLKTAKPAQKEEAKAEVIASAEDVLKEMREAGADADLISKLVTAIRTENETKIKALVEPLQKALEDTRKSTEKLTAKEAEADRVKLERQTLGGEWGSILPDLKKSYPNATEELLSDAQKLMAKLATSKEYGGESVDGTENKGKQPMPLDYIWFKERKQFDTLLKVKAGRSGEGTGKDMGDDEDDGSDDPDKIDLRPDDMTPKKFKEYERRKAKNMKPEEIEIIR